MLIAGIDPGRDGGIAVLDENAEIIALKLLRTVIVKQFLLELGCKILWIEKAQPMGGESAKAMFNYGREYGYLLGTLAGTGIDVNFVPPAVWTAKLHQKSAVAMTHKKAASEYAAKQIWPHETFLASDRCRKAHDGLFEAALIAYFGHMSTFGTRQGLI
jgi:hypothetical protein